MIGAEDAPRIHIREVYYDGLPSNRLFFPVRAYCCPRSGGIILIHLFLRISRPRMLASTSKEDSVAERPISVIYRTLTPPLFDISLSWSLQVYFFRQKIFYLLNYGR